MIPTDGDGEGGNFSMLWSILALDYVAKNHHKIHTKYFSSKFKKFIEKSHQTYPEQQLTFNSKKVFNVLFSQNIN